MVHLYELALALNVRSADLAAVAAQRGVDGLGTGSRLTLAQTRFLQALVFELGVDGIAAAAGSTPGPLDAGQLGVEALGPPAVAQPPGRLLRVVRRRRRTRAA